jgi:beta-phosphoglucomutase
MAVATAAGKANREFVLGSLRITPYFNSVVGAEDVKNGKPHPEIFLKAAARLDVVPGSCVVFEDAVAGVEAAGRAGMRAAALTTSLDAREFGGLPAVICARTDYVGLEPRDLVEALTQA